ncbi:hypothetical protein FOA52_000836 [Chlamydomonas sp. UWO 241]|nr:hypothetical protein FOA52_000836 [Chlamydomonas sp. UWO 241]
MSNALLGFGSRAELESNFAEWCKRSENKRQVEEAQATEVKSAIKLREAQAAAAFHQKLQLCSQQAQTSFAPYLRYPVLRRVIQTFGNDSLDDAVQGEQSRGSGGSAASALEAWASNPRVLQLLGHAKQQLDSGALSERQLEHHLLAQLKASGNADRAQFEAAASRSVVLPAAMLVSALNEHLEERRAGSAASKDGRHQDALTSFGRALAIVEFVRGGTPADQEEVDRNRLASLLALASTHDALKDYGAAAARASQALELQPRSVAARLRRARALALRGEYEAAEADIAAAEEVHGGNDGRAAEAGEDLRALMARLRVRDKRTDRAFCARMFA